MASCVGGLRSFLEGMPACVEDDLLLCAYFLQPTSLGLSTYEVIELFVCGCREVPCLCGGPWGNVGDALSVFPLVPSLWET